MENYVFIYAIYYVLHNVKYVYILESLDRANECICAENTSSLPSVIIKNTCLVITSSLHYRTELLTLLFMSNWNFVSFNQQQLAPDLLCGLRLQNHRLPSTKVISETNC